ncbi:TRAP transporter substrate-binding protein [Paucidesulfovibrio longus]|uniref:TRAP transporter substrate-binding protein n=1 Tax=Paucidesulfovibrio longus TaxID=889 RepID=UPI0003B37B8D|nr:TRAP transporter substrate-binding protein [Paucidesulfovibrio longus]
MKRIFLLTALLGALLLAGCGGSGDQQAAQKSETQTEGQPAAEAPAKPEPVKLTYANFPPAFTVPCVQMERWKDEVQNRSDGAVAVETFPGGTLLNAKNMLRGVIEGQADIGCVAMSYMPGVFPLSSVVEMPVGFHSGKTSSQVLWAMYEKYQPAELKDVKVLTLFATPPSNIMSRTPVKSIADMQGLELRGNGTSGKFLDALGAVTVSMPMPEVPDALQKSIVQGLYTSLEVLQDMKFAEFCPYATITDGPVYIFAVVMNKAKWDALPEAAKKAMDGLSAEQAAWTGEYWDTHTAEAVEWAIQNHGLQVFEFSDEDKATAREKSAAIIDAWKQSATAAGLPADQIMDDLLAFKAQFAN